ncbi:EpsG family protein [Psychrobacter sp. F1192]|uniref:EpsG family protein n=1 Tax=Psychrobacter coccoides TaxID=2818440 RepID=A0ABS3NSR5_9GAMM|nr:EpsG family protein [Psychrobacter coccoides]MBO1532080.1 EpsG family protein [Psychrobacter coccoides]
MKLPTNHTQVRIEKDVLGRIFLSFFLALAVSLVPWEVLREGVFLDRIIYSRYIDFYPNRVYWFDFSTLISKISNEWGWHYFLDFLQSRFGFDSSAIFFTVTLFFLTITFVLVSATKRFYYCLFLISPIFIDFFYSQLRQTFAMAFIYFSMLLLNRSKVLSVLLLIPPLFIHTSSVLFVFIFYSAIFLEKNETLKEGSKFVISIAIGAFLAFITGPYMSVILASFDDRRADYDDMSSPFIYMIYWILLFIFFMIKFLIKDIKNLNHYYFYITMVILTMIVLSYITGGYPSRFLSSALPFLVLTVGSLKGRLDSFAIVGYIFYTVAVWFFWLT